MLVLSRHMNKTGMFTTRIQVRKPCNVIVSIHKYILDELRSDLLSTIKMTVSDD